MCVAGIAAARVDLAVQRALVHADQRGQLRQHRGGEFGGLLVREDVRRAAITRSRPRLLASMVMMSR
jgi:hypothetical protein